MMAEEQKQRVEEEQTAMHNVSAGAFLLLGIEIQGLQWIWFTGTGVVESMDDPLTCQGGVYYAII